MSLPAPPAAALAEILGPSTRVYARVEIYEEDGMTPWDRCPLANFESGSVSVDSSRDERRMLDLSLNNSDGLLALTPEELWYDKILKVYRGVFYTDEDGSEQVWAPQVGEFMVDQCNEKNFPATIAIKGLDYTAKLEGDKFYTSTTFVKGVSPESIVRAVATNGYVTKMALPITGITTGKDFVFEKETTRWQAIKDVCAAYSYDIFFDATGTLIMSEFQDPLLTPSVYSFKLDESSAVISWDKTVGQSMLYNAVAVYGETSSTTGLTVFAKAENHNPDSPSSIERLRRRKTYTYTSSFISTVEQAQPVADSFLAIHSLEDFTISMQTLVLPWIEAGEIIDFDAGRNDFDPTRFLLSSFNIPLTLGTMDPNAKRVVIAG